MHNIDPPLNRQRIRRGVTLDFVPEDERELHLELMRAEQRELGPGTYFNKASAGVLFGLPLWDADLTRSHAVRLLGGHGQIGSFLHAYRRPKVLPDTTVVNGFRCTTLARTAADLMRYYKFGPALAVADAALRLGASREVLLQEVKGGRGCRIATEAALRADARSESPYESLCRALMLQHGIPLPELQVSLTDEDGFIGRVDFYWKSKRLVGEFDGKVKLTKLLPAGQSAADVLKARENRDRRLRARGETVLHWDAGDIHDVDPFVESIREHTANTKVDHHLCPEAMGYKRPRRSAS